MSQMVTGRRDESLAPISVHGASQIDTDGVPVNDSGSRLIEGPRVNLTELLSIVRHSKFTLLKEALDYLPNKSFDKSLVRVIFSRILNV